MISQDVDGNFCEPHFLQMKKLTPRKSDWHNFMQTSKLYPDIDPSFSNFSEKKKNFAVIILPLCDH